MRFLAAWHSMESVTLARDFSVNQYGRNAFFWLIIVFGVILLFNMMGTDRQAPPAQELSLSEFVSRVKNGDVSSVVIKNDIHVDGQTVGGQRFQTRLLKDTETVQKLLMDSNVNVRVSQGDDGSPTLLQVLLSWFPMLLLIGLWVFFLRQMQQGSNKAMGFGKSKAKMMTEAKGRVTFEDVAGVEEAKEEVSEIVDFLKDPQKFHKLGGKIPKGVLLVGPPGTGKTLLGRAIAGEANVPFFSISGSEFVEMFVGVGASRVRDLFEQGKKNAPCIIFIDEIDAVGRHRGAGLGGGNDEREQTLNQMLVEMDGFEANEGVIILAATNRPDVLDPALLRPGRFDRQVVVPLPDVTGRERILSVHMRRVPLADNVRADVIAKGTPGFSGADLENLVNEAALLAARKNKRIVTASEFDEARDKIMMGPERRSMIMTEDEKKVTAYHEAGHAVAALNMPDADPIHKATIIPRGRALGMVQYIPEKDQISITRSQLKSRLVTALGGRVAEEIIFGQDNVTTGASSDFKAATDIATRMVKEWGMSDKMGPMSYGNDSQEVFLGHSVTQQQAMSEKTAEMVDAEVRKLIDEAYKRTQEVLKKDEKFFKALAEALLEFETLTGDEINDLRKGKKPEKRETPVEKPRKKTSLPGSYAKAGKATSSSPVKPLKSSKKPTSRKKKDDGDKGSEK